MAPNNQEKNEFFWKLRFYIIFFADSDREYFFIRINIFELGKKNFFLKKIEKK
jgi:hypothetical protein